MGSFALVRWLKSWWETGLESELGFRLGLWLVEESGDGRLWGIGGEFIGGWLSKACL